MKDPDHAIKRVPTTVIIIAIYGTPFLLFLAIHFGTNPCSANATTDLGVRTDAVMFIPPTDLTVPIGIL